MVIKHTRLEAEVDDLSIEYPDSDGEPMAEDDAQLFAMIDTISTLRQWFAGRPEVYAGGDMLIYYRMNDNETRVAPDVFVVVGAGNHSRRSWIVWREGLTPDFVMEMASGSTWRRDMREKREIYAEMGVREYWRFDPSGRRFRPVLVGERLVDGEYAGMPVGTGDDGILRGHSSVLGLDLCVLADGHLRLYDPAGGQWLRTHREAEATLQAETAARQSAESALREEAAARQSAESALREEAAARQSAENELQRLRAQLRSRQPGE